MLTGPVPLVAFLVGCSFRLFLLYPPLSPFLFPLAFVIVLASSSCPTDIGCLWSGLRLLLPQFFPCLPAWVPLVGSLAIHLPCLRSVVFSLGASGRVFGCFSSICLPCFPSLPKQCIVRFLKQWLRSGLWLVLLHLSPMSPSLLVPMSASSSCLFFCFPVSSLCFSFRLPSCLPSSCCLPFVPLLVPFFVLVRVSALPFCLPPCLPSCWLLCPPLPLGPPGLPINHQEGTQEGTKGGRGAHGNQHQGRQKRD